MIERMLVDTSTQSVWGRLAGSSDKVHIPASELNPRLIASGCQANEFWAAFSLLAELAEDQL